MKAKKISTLLFIISTGMMVFPSCDKDNTAPGDGGSSGGISDETSYSQLPPDVQAFMSTSMFAILESDLNMPINTGSNPPCLEGSFLVDPFEVLSTNIVPEPGDDFGPGTQLNAALLQFCAQTSTTITFYNPPENPVGYISGRGANFTIFSLTDGESNGIEFEGIQLMSGTIEQNGIVNYSYGYLMLDDGNNPSEYVPDNGEGYVAIDTDGLADRQSDEQCSGCVGQVDSYDCVNGNCEISENGQFATLNECQTECDEQEGPAGCDGSTSFIDPRDGQSYEIVQIGNQCWFAENLRLEGGVPEITDAVDWQFTLNNQQPGWCHYDNMESFGLTYGKLYNWYAVNTGTLCPDGWHIPIDEEWSELEDFLGGSSIAGGKLKATFGWSEPNTGATDETGFTGLPGGIRNDGGFFENNGEQGYWWSSTQSGSGWAMMRRLGYDSNNLSSTAIAFRNGISCRCIHD